MSEEQAGTVELVSQLIDEIRGDTTWREELESKRRGDRAPAEEPQVEDMPKPSPPPTAPPRDPALGAALSAGAAALSAAEAVVPIESGRPVIGEAWAVLRRQIHADIRIYGDRQSAVNHELMAALRRIDTALDAGDPVSALGAAWSAIGGLHTRLEVLDARVRDLERVAKTRLTAIEQRVGSLEQAGAALTAEIEPLGALRVAVDELLTRRSDA
jgi:hypothetical protein